MRWLLRPSRLAILAVGLVLLYALGGFFLIPYLIKTYAIPVVSEKLKRPVLVKEVELNPFSLSLRITGLEIRESDQSALLGFEEFFVNLQASSLIRRAYVFDTIRLTVPYVSARVFKDGRMNLAELMPPDDGSPPAAPLQAEQPPSQVPAIEIGEFEIVQGVVEFRDESKPKPYALDIVPIHIVLKNFHTKPGGDNSYAFTAELGEGETLSWAGRVSLEPVQSSGTFTLSGVKLPGLWQYLHDRFRFDVIDGTVAADAGYAIDAGANPMKLQVSQANVRIETLAVKEDGSLDPVITIPVLNVEGVDVDLATHEVTVRNVAVERASFIAWLNPDGTANYQQMFMPVDSAQPPPAAGTAVPPAQDEKPWAVLLKEITLKDHAIDFEDRTLTTPAHVEVRDLTVKTRDVRIPIKEALPIDVDMRLNETGTIRVNGSVLPDPFQADVTLALKSIAIRPFQPYFEKFARIDVVSGAVNVSGTARLATDHPNGPFMSYEGNVSVEALSVADRDQGNEVASLRALSLNTVRVTVDPTTVSIKEVGIQEPMAHLVVLPDGGLNLSKLAAPASASVEEKPAAPQKAKSPPVPVTVGVVKLAKAAVTFRDDSVQPPVRTGLSALTGTIKGLSSKQLARADVDLSGRVDKVAPLKIFGTINPLSDDTFTDLAITLGGMDLTAESPYSGKYVGYVLSKGKLSLDLKYKVSQKQLEAENKVLVDQLTFGEKVDSPDATSLPVPLVVALLKDRKGRIDIDLPIRGDLQDPDFKYGKVVLSTLLNLLTKLVASPFSLMGKLIPGGGDEEDLQFIAFSPGSATVAEEELKKIDALAKGLEERPNLRLDIVGTADPVRDRQALNRMKLQANVQAIWQRERGKPSAKGEPVPVEDEQRLIRQLYEDYQKKTAPAAAPLKTDTPVQPPTYEDMTRVLVAAMPLEEEALRTLARQRADHVREQLTGEGRLADERVFLLDVDLNASDHEQIRSRLAIAAAP